MGRAARARQAEREDQALAEVPMGLPGEVALMGQRIPWKVIAARSTEFREQDRVMEREAVRAARLAGATWGEIAGAFGNTISRVQLARRYRELEH